jgi:hypothetical protein
MNKVKNLKKITLSFQAGTSADAMDLMPMNPRFEFIFGLSPEGMTPFEYELVDQPEGREVLLHLNRQSLGSFFEHLNPPLLDLFSNRSDVHLKARIEAVTAAENREIVKALAKMAEYSDSECSCGCDGGSCGCGG